MTILIRTTFERCIVMKLKPQFLQILQTIRECREKLEPLPRVHFYGVNDNKYVLELECEKNVFWYVNATTEIINRIFEEFDIGQTVTVLPDEFYDGDFYKRVKEIEVELEEKTGKKYNPQMNVGVSPNNKMVLCLDKSLNLRIKDDYDNGIYLKNHCVNELLRMSA